MSPRTVLLAVVATVALLLVAPAAQAAPANSKQAQQIRTLKRQLANARESRLTWIEKERVARLAASTARNEAGALATRLRKETGALTGQIQSLNAQLATFATEVASLTQQRDAARGEAAGLKGGLPEQVATIARTGDARQLQELVLLPAHSNWACRGSIFYGSTFFSFDFDRRASDGSCY